MVCCCRNSTSTISWYCFSGGVCVCACTCLSTHARTHIFLNRFLRESLQGRKFQCCWRWTIFFIIGCVFFNASISKKEQIVLHKMCCLGNYTVFCEEKLGLVYALNEAVELSVHLFTVTVISWQSCRDWVCALKAEASLHDRCASVEEGVESWCHLSNLFLGKIMMV